MTVSNDLFLSKADLLSVQCGACVFRLNGQCFHKELIVDDKSSWDKGTAQTAGCYNSDSHVDGVCPDVMTWLFSLGDSPALVWENYHLFVSRLQASEDYKSFKELNFEISRLRESGVKEGELEVLKMKETAARVWWSRGVEGVLKGLGRVADRDSRRDNVETQTKALGLDALHSVIVGKVGVEEVKQIPDLGKDEGDD